MAKERIPREVQIEKALHDYAVEDRGHTTPCWIFRVGNEYGAAYIGNGEQAIAHRLFYEHHIGAIPDGLVLDHLCRVKMCVNPEHLEPVTQRENCIRGLPYKKSLHRPPAEPKFGVFARFTPEELMQLDWLCESTMRSRAGAVKWAVAEIAEQMGYVADKEKKK